MEKITINGITYFLTRKKNMRRIILKIKNGEIIVSAPYYVPIKEINHFVLSSKDQIHEMKSKKNTKVEYKQNGIFKYLGETYQIKLINKNKMECEIIDKTIYVYHQNIEKCLKSYMKKSLYKIVEILVDKYPLTRGDEAFTPRIEIKEVISTYGVCFYKKNKIRISLMMIHEPIEAIEYVVVHELTHFIHQNHSKDFYKTVENLFPNYKEAIKFLKNGGA